jgi:mono/diheme cytochrome c family protein
MNMRSGYWSAIGLLVVSVYVQADAKSVQRGEYLTTILGCGGCHTEGSFLGKQTGPWLAGSAVGIAYTDTIDGDSPGVVYPGNLTPDVETGLGNWSKQDVVRMIQSGINHDESMVLPVMPWRNYNRLHKEDLEAIADYLMSLAPVDNAIPPNTGPGEAAGSYIRVGMYLFDADGELIEQYGRPPVD